jgi:sugar O-acyltransferase (sialic acid O-acetyltransferase NeuD family)
MLECVAPGAMVRDAGAMPDPDSRTRPAPETNTVVVIGGGGHAKVLIGVIRKLPWGIAGYVDPRDVGRVLGVAYAGGDDVLPDLLARHPGCAAAMGVGKVDATDRRSRIQDAAEALGYRFPAIVSPDAIVNDEVELGAGTAVFDGAVVNPGVVTGPICVVNTNATVEHDCQLGTNVHVATGATVSGGVTIGDHTFVGAGAVVIHGVRIAPGCLIGAGAVVTADLTEPGTYVGAPARRIR